MKVLGLIISLLGLLVAIIALRTIHKIDFSKDAKQIVSAISENTKATKNITERNAIGIEFTDPPLEKVNLWRIL